MGLCCPIRRDLAVTQFYWASNNCRTACIGLTTNLSTRLRFAFPCQTRLFLTPQQCLRWPQIISAVHWVAQSIPEKSLSGRDCREVIFYWFEDQMSWKLPLSSLVTCSRHGSEHGHSPTYTHSTSKSPNSFSPQTWKSWHCSQKNPSSMVHFYPTHYRPIHCCPLVIMFQCLHTLLHHMHLP